MNYNKNLLLFCYILLMGCSSDKREVDVSNQGYRIEGNVTSFSDGTKFYLYDLERDLNVDSATVTNNTFLMEGHIADSPSAFWLRATDGDDYVYTPLLIGNDDLTVSADKKDFAWNVKTSGSTIDANYRKLLEVTKELDMQRDSLIFNFHSLPDLDKEETLEDYLKKVVSMDSIIKNRTIQYLMASNDTYASVSELSNYLYDLPKDSIRTIFDRYKEELKESKFGKVIKTHLESKNMEKGDLFLDFEGLGPSGNQIKLSDIMEENKFILINYTSAYCGHCINATEELKVIHEKYKNSLNIVSFSADPQKNDWLHSVERDGNLWPSLWDGKGRYSESAIRYNFSATPTFLLIDKDGKIVDRWVGYSEGKLMKEIETYL